MHALRSARRRSAVQRPDGLAPEPSAYGGFRRGLIGDLLNPKVRIFYTTVFPQFIGPDDAVVPAAAALLAAHTVVLMTWYPGTSHLGSALIGLGIRMAVVPL
ncbi:hypothetical protein AQJ91_47430 [Streptomyces dysideae]|uniref:Uncharacterized protein n=1 Tax=Streptomyces dysideae TaxID=909626 RepID=A0A101UPC0_9ACTN|nr:hypothetical protein AQJ91_47430 [Streptomyces dysideae]